MEKIMRECVVCGKKIIIELFVNRNYKGGNYFGKINLDNKLIEYWECDSCFNK